MGETGVGWRVRLAVAGVRVEIVVRAVMVELAGI